MATSKSKSPRLGRGLSSLLATPVAVETPTEEPAEASHAAPMTDAQSKTGDTAKESPASSQPATPASVDTIEHGDRVQRLAITTIVANPNQPRKTFNDHTLAELAESIKQDGLMQPIVVRQKGADEYELIVGERRWRAAQLADLTAIPAIVRDMSDEQSASWALVENLQREDLNSIERAEAFEQLHQQFAMSHEQIAERVGIQRSSVTNSLRLLSLSAEVKQLIREDLLSAGQAKAIASLDDPNAQLAFAQKAIRESWSVRKIEQAVRDMLQASTLQPAETEKKPPRQIHLADLERQITRQLGTKVKVKTGRKKGTGKLTIDFSSNEQFESLLEKLGVEISE